MRRPMGRSPWDRQLLPIYCMFLGDCKVFFINTLDKWWKWHMKKQRNVHLFPDIKPKHLARNLLFIPILSELEHPYKQYNSKINRQTLKVWQYTYMLLHGISIIELIRLIENLFSLFSDRRRLSMEMLTWGDDGKNLKSTIDL